MINVEITMTMAAVGMVSLLINNVVKLIKMNAMIEFISFIVVEVMTLVEGQVSISAMISHRTRPLYRTELG